LLMEKSTTNPTASRNQPTVVEHNHAVRKEMEQLANSLQLDERIAKTMVWAAECHDLGKNAAVWQRAIYNTTETAYAKSGKRGMNIALLGNTQTGYYRHEFGSVLEAMKKVPDGVDLELAIYLIATHHGHGRPFFKSGAMGPDYYGTPEAQELLESTPVRFVRLQSQYGKWGLAWLHALFCTADIRGSRS
jgi:CRISPR-associated endonuclease/helicase Cas3